MPTGRDLYADGRKAWKIVSHDLVILGAGEDDDEGDD